MIARKNRFHGHNAVSRVKGSTIGSQRLSFRFQKNTKNDYRLAVVVSKKVDNRATVRNRIRRRIFEAIRTQGKLNGLPLDVVVYAKDAGLATIESADLEADIDALTTQMVERLHT